MATWLLLLAPMRLDQRALLQQFSCKLLTGSGRPQPGGTGSGSQHPCPAPGGRSRSCPASVASEEGSVLRASENAAAAMGMCAGSSLAKIWRSLSRTGLHRGIHCIQNAPQWQKRPSTPTYGEALEVGGLGGTGVPVALAGLAHNGGAAAGGSAGGQSRSGLHREGHF